METAFLNQMTELLERETPVQMNDIFRDYDNWDSLAYLSVISFVDEEYELVIPRDTFKSLLSIKDLWEYILQNK
jgi:acyl carrier protein